jgi:hypothetical protein
MGLAAFNCAIANVRCKYEKTMIIDLLYTDDADFRLVDLGIIRSQKEFDDIENGKINYINPEKTYVMKTVTREMYSGTPESVIDIVFYIPEAHLFSID